MAKKLKLGSGLENLINQKIKNSYSTSTTDSYSCNYINNNVKGSVTRIYDSINHAGKFTLKESISSYSFIIVSTSTNIYKHYTYSNIYNVDINDLKSWTYQRLFYPDDTGNLIYAGTFQLYDNIIDTTGLSNIGQSGGVIIYGVYGVKL